MPLSKQPSDFEQKLQKLRELYADASEVSRTALENVIRSLGSGVPANASEKKLGAPLLPGTPLDTGYCWEHRRLMPLAVLDCLPSLQCTNRYAAWHAPLGPHSSS